MAISLFQFNMKSLLLDTASKERLVNMYFIAFADASNQTVYTPLIAMPQQYAGGVLTVRMVFAFQTEVTDNALIGVSWDAMTPSSDTQNLITGSSFDTEKTTTVTPTASTGNPTEINLTFSNAAADDIVAGDAVQLKIRRVVTGESPVATDDLRMYALEIQE